MARGDGVRLEGAVARFHGATPFGGRGARAPDADEMHCAAGPQEGVRGLYKGLVPSMLGIVPYLTLSLTAYDSFKVRDSL